jgi:transposase
MALTHIQKLYRLEIQLKDKTSEQKYQGRQEKARPLLAMFYQWLEKANVPPKTALGKAIQYCKNQWHKLTRYIENGDLNIDNNEQNEPFVIGRKKLAILKYSKWCESQCNALFSNINRKN